MNGLSLAGSILLVIAYVAAGAMPIRHTGQIPIYLYVAFLGFVLSLVGNRGSKPFYIWMRNRYGGRRDW